MGTEYFTGAHRFNFGLPYQTPLRGETGSPRKLTEAKNSPIATKSRKFPGNSSLKLRVAVPDPLTCVDRPEAHGS